MYCKDIETITSIDLQTIFYYYYLIIEHFFHHWHVCLVTIYSHFTPLVLLIVIVVSLSLSVQVLTLTLLGSLKSISWFLWFYKGISLRVNFVHTTQGRDLVRISY